LEEHLVDPDVHLNLVRAHLAVLEPAGQAEADLIKTVPPPTPGVPTKEAEVAAPMARKVPTKRAKAASVSRKGDPTEEAELVVVSRRRASSNRTKRASPPEENKELVCPIDECRESAAHPLNGCKGFGGLLVTKRRKVLKERGFCGCCLTDCRDKETGARCYQQTGFRRHRLLRLAVQQEVTLANREEQKGDQS
jgi:hypothetical protein